MSSFTGYERGRDEFIRGAELLGLNTKRKPILPLQYQVADALQAQDEDGIPLHVINAFCIPRRTTKTTSVWAVALGRISNPERDSYMVAFTAQTQVKARARFLKDVVAPLERKYPDAKDAPFIINRGAATSSITWKATGGVLSILGPHGDSFRGDAYDLVVIDEAQEVEPGADSEELLQGILPTFDTRPEAQLVLIGTAGEHKGGIFWDQLEVGRAGDGGIIEYAANPSTPDYDPDVDESPEGTTADPEVWLSAHPGIGALTPLAAVERNFKAMSLAAFKREYLGLWPTGDRNSFLPADKWEKCRTPGDLPSLEALHREGVRFALAFAVHPEGSSASITAAWRDEKGLAHLLLVEHAQGVKWATPKLLALARKYKTAIIYDSRNSVGQVEVEQLQRANPRPKLEPQSWFNVRTSAALLVKELSVQALRHYDQPAMNEAAQKVVKRSSRDSKDWAFGRKEAGDDITPLESASLALRVYDEKPAPQALWIAS